MPQDEIIVDDKNQDNSDVSNETPNKDNSQDDSNADNEKSEQTYKQRYSDSSREAKHIKHVSEAYRHVLKDNSYLLELDENIATEVVKQLHADWFAKSDSYKEVIDFLKSNAKDSTDDKDIQKPLNEEEIVKNVRAKILQEQEEEKAQNILDKALSKLDNDVKKEYLKEFKEVLWDRKLTPAFAEKEIAKIILYYNKEQNKQNRSDDALSNIASNWLGNWTRGSETSMTLSKLKELWIPKADQQKLYPDLFPKN